MQILIGWELGGNYGHILGLLPILKTLRQRSHDILLVVRDISIAEETLHNTGCSFIQAPIPRRKAPLNRDIANYGDILAFHGFAERDVLFSLVHAWQHLYRLYRPDVVVINHAPAALFSVRLSDIPTVEIGTGFELLPRSIPYPCFRPWLDLPDAALAQTEEIILTSLNTLRNAHQKTPHAALCDSLCADTRLLMTFSEIDHYPNRENTEYIGPLFTFIIKSRPMKIKLLATICVVLLFFGIASGAHAEMETFNFEWSGESFGNTAVATGNITMDAAALLSSGQQDFRFPDPRITDLTLMISGAGSGNGTFTLDDFSNLYFGAPAVLDLTTNLVGQLTGTSMFGSSDGEGGDFNLFGNGAPAPTGSFFSS